MYVGQEHLQHYFRTSDQEMLMPARPINKLCHRIDSACVQKSSFPMPKLFGSASHPVDLKYNSLEENAFTQVYIAYSMIGDFSCSGKMPCSDGFAQTFCGFPDVYVYVI